MNAEELIDKIAFQMDNFETAAGRIQNSNIDEDTRLLLDDVMKHADHLLATIQEAIVFLLSER